jgi:predicted esterase
LYPGPADGVVEAEYVFPSFLRLRSDHGSIIAVHGLGANVDWSWTWKDGDQYINWLRESNMLPAKAPKSRIMVYNYESRWHADAAKTRLQLCGEELVRSVHDSDLRKGMLDRPIIFIGHSLGGLVVQHVSFRRKTLQMPRQC